MKRNPKRGRKIHYTIFHPNYERITHHPSRIWTCYSNSEHARTLRAAYRKAAKFPAGVEIERCFTRGKLHKAGLCQVFRAD